MASGALGFLMANLVVYTVELYLALNLSTCPPQSLLLLCEKTGAIALASSTRSYGNQAVR